MTCLNDTGLASSPYSLSSASHLLQVLLITNKYILASAHLNKINTILNLRLSGTDEEKKALVDFANQACSRPCAMECTAPRCCDPPEKPSVTRI